jgi:hypothetical protein
MVALMRDPNVPYALFAHPMFWAPFSIVGEVRQ